VGDVERELAATALAQHYEAGRLSAEEYDERSAGAFAARTGGDLEKIFADLPEIDASLVRAAQRSGRGGRPARGRTITPTARQLGLTPELAMMLRLRTTPTYRPLSAGTAAPRAHGTLVPLGQPVPTGQTVPVAGMRVSPARRQQAHPAAVAILLVLLTLLPLWMILLSEPLP
jgi:hypothetical protein